MSWLGSLAGVYDSLVEVGKINPGKVKGLMPPVIIEQNAHLKYWLTKIPSSSR